MMKKHLLAIALLFVVMGFVRAGGQTLTNLHTLGSSSTDGVQPVTSQSMWQQAGVVFPDPCGRPGIAHAQPGLFSSRFHRWSPV